MLGATLGAIEILLVASGNRNQDKLRPRGPSGFYTDLTFTLVVCSQQPVVSWLPVPNKSLYWSIVYGISAKYYWYIPEMSVIYQSNVLCISANYLCRRQNLSNSFEFGVKFSRN